MKNILKYVSWIVLIMSSFTICYIIGHKQRNNEINNKQFIQRELYPSKNKKYPPIKITTTSGKEVKYNIFPLLWLFENGEYMVTYESNYCLPYEEFEIVTLKPGESLNIDFQENYDALSIDIKSKHSPLYDGQVITPEWESRLKMKIVNENGRYIVTPPQHQDNYFTILAMDYERGIVSFWIHVVIEDENS